VKKAVLIAINSKYVHTSLSVRVLASGVSRYARVPWETSIVEATLQQDNDDIAAQAAAYQPDVTGISVYIWNAEKVKGLLCELRKRLPETVFVLGGPEAAFNAEHWLQNGADYVVRGEGERSFPMLLDAVSEQTEPEAVPGLVWLSNGTMHCNSEAAEPDGWIDPYTNENDCAGRIIYTETSRGCPFRCAYCQSGGSSVRFMPLEAAKEQLTKLSQSNAKTIKLVDRTFNCDPLRAYELFAHVIDMDTSCRFHFEAAADLFDDRTVALLRTAPPGRIQLETGLQSYCKPALEAVCRHHDVEKAEHYIQALLHGQNIHVHVDIIAGLPYETISDFQSGFNRAYALRAHHLQLGFLKLLHGSALRARAEALGIKYEPQPPYEIIESPWLSNEDLRTLKQAENALQHTYNKGRFLKTMQYAVAALKCTPFELYLCLGKTAENRGTALDVYAEQIYHCLLQMGADKNALIEHMQCDWLGMVKGKNRPAFLKNTDEQKRHAVKTAENALGRKIGRGEAAVLPSGKTAFVNSLCRDAVTGLYELHVV
jgi:radical SAM superfamily enzyme YgiQ (UPF0313 family)